MANIHGLPMIMSLLFCPTMEPKLTADGSKIAAVLCGLGIDELTSRSMFPPHDICLTLDTELTEDDMNQVGLYLCLSTRNDYIIYFIIQIIVYILDKRIEILDECFHKFFGNQLLSSSWCYQFC